MTDLKSRHQTLERVQSLVEQSDELYYKDRQAALNASEEALVLLDQHDDLALRAATLRTLGQSYIASGELERAEPYYADALSLYDALDDAQARLLGQTRCRLGMAGIAKRRSDYNTALTHQHHAVHSAQELGDRLLEAKARNNLGLTHWSLKQIDSALDQFFRAVELLNDTDDEEFLLISAAVHSNAGLIYSSLEEHAQAVDQYEQSVVLIQRTPFEVKEANFTFRLAEALLEVDRADESRQHFERAAELMSRDVDSHRGELYEVRGHLAWLDGDAEAAISSLQRARSLWMSNQDERQHANVCVHLARVYLLNNQSELAQSHLEHAWSLSCAIDDEQYMRISCRALIALHQTRQQWKEAFQWSERLRSLEREISQNMRDQHYADIEHKYQLASKAQAASVWREHSEHLESQVVARTAELEQVNTMLLSEVMQHQSTVRQLKIARDAAESALKAKTSFLAVTSHELRTPLNAIIGYTQMVLEELELDSVEAPEAVEDLHRVLASADHLLSMIERVLELSNLESGLRTLHPETFQVQELFTELEDIFAQRIQFSGNVVHVRGRVSLILKIDRRAIYHVLYQLIDNALKFTKDGEITLSVDLTSDSLEFAVTDTGEGMSAQSATALFDAFAQQDVSYTREHGGLGLGLTLCRHYAVLLDGHLAIDLKWSPGARFVLSLPTKWLNVIE